VKQISIVRLLPQATSEKFSKIGGLDKKRVIGCPHGAADCAPSLRTRLLSLADSRASRWAREEAGVMVRARAAVATSTPLVLGVVLAALVCYPFAGGRLLLLDFVSGPH